MAENEAKTVVAAETRQAVVTFLRSVTSKLSTRSAHTEPGWDDLVRWARGPDGHFRRAVKRRPSWWRCVDGELFDSVPEHAACVDRLTLDPLVAKHLGSLVGTRRGAMRLDTEQILRSLLFDSLAEVDDVRFDETLFENAWQSFADFMSADEFPIKTVAPIPGLRISAPVRLNDELVLDFLTEGEVTRCAQVGVLRPPSESFPLIQKEVAIGLRRAVFMPKLIGDLDSGGSIDYSDEGHFGRRPSGRDDLVVGDVLSAFRLFKSSRAVAAGIVSWTESEWVSSGIVSTVLGRWPFGAYEILDSELDQFMQLWQLLELEASRLDFSIHRFSLAFDRGYNSDRIVDLVIAAESLLLSDTRTSDRGELRFRFALRAAKFIEHLAYGERDVFRIMRSAYDARSAIVHGGSPDNTRLPENPTASLSVFSDAVEALVRQALRKALAMGSTGESLRNPDFWIDLILATD